MWTDKELESLIDITIERMVITKMKNPYSWVNLGGHCPVEDYKGEAKSMTPGQRAYLGLYFCAFLRKDYTSLVLLCRGDHSKAAILYTKIQGSNNSYHRDIANLSLSRIQRLIDKVKITPRKRQPGWGPQDIPVESFSINTEVDAYRAHTPQKDAVRDIIGPASPVRKVSAEEYYATRRIPSPKGVALEFEKESSHWTQEKEISADKNSRDEVPEWYTSHLLKEFGE